MLRDGSWAFATGEGSPSLRTNFLGWPGGRGEARVAVFQKHFTVEEANALLPELKDLLEQLQGWRDRAVVTLHEAAPVLRMARSNGGGREASGYLEAIQELNGRLKRLAELNVQLKDLEAGLVDFPHLRGDREVFLCWKLGEDRVSYWHELEEGFRGRQPL